LPNLRASKPLRIYFSLFLDAINFVILSAISDKKINRIKSGVPGLDNMFYGGIVKETTVFVPGVYRDVNIFSPAKISYGDFFSEFFQDYSDFVF